MNTREQLSQRVNQMGADVKEAGRNMWLAGLGAVSTIDERRRDVVSDLVSRGEKMDPKVDLDLMKPVAEVTERVTEATERVKTLGGKVERKVEDGMSQTLNRLGIPARGDVQELIKRVELLTLKVDALAKS